MTATAHNIPVLKPHMFLGLNPSIKGNACFVTDYDIIYPAGGVLVIHNYTQKEQKYIKLPDPTKVISRIVLSPNKRLVAVAEQGEKPCIILYDVATLKRKKVLGMPYESSVREFSSVTFTHDSKYVLAVTGDPDWMMLQYNWMKGKVETSVKANNPPASPGPVVQVASNPVDNSVVSLVGPGLFRLLAASEMAWRQFGFQKAENLPFSSVCWLSGDVTLAGTRDGRLVIVEGGDLRALYRASDSPVIDREDRALRAGQGIIGINLLQEGYKADDSGENEVRCLVSFSRGFAYSCSSGVVFLYEKETPYRYRKRNVFTISAGDIKNQSTQEMNQIQHIAVNPSQEQMICTTKRMQIYFVLLWGKDITQCPEINFNHLGVSLHHGPVVGLALCSWKQIMMTCGELDQTVRIWDYTTKTIIMEKKYSESVYCLTLHPTGLYTVMGFENRLDYKLVLIDNLKCIRSFPICCCNEARFSKSGHMFGAVNVSDIHIYSTVTFHLIFNFKGHTGKINTLFWTKNDLVVQSCDEDGILCEWDLFEGKQSAFTNIQGAQHNDLVATHSGTAYFVSNDGILREIIYYEISKDIDMKQTQLDRIILSRSEFMMFVAGDDGSIHSLKYPWTSEPDFLTFSMHSQRIVKMRLSYDDQTLISCSQDGTMCIWKVTKAEHKIVAMDPNFRYSNEILIGKSELRDKISTIDELSVRIKELDQEQVLRTRQMETAHKEKVEELHSGYCTAIQELKEKNQELEMTHTVEIDKINNQIKKTKTDHDAEMTRLETNYKGKLVVEYQNYKDLQDEFSIWRADFNKKYDELIGLKKVAIEEMIESYEEKVKEKEAKLEELHEELKRRNEKHEENKCLIEDDTDKELTELRTVNEAQLQIEREANDKLRADLHIMKNEFNAAQREIEDLRFKLASLHKDQKQLKIVIKGIEKDINDLNKENTERDNLIQEKEKNIYELKIKHQELEKFKNILDYKIEDIKEQLKPKENEIKKRTEQLIDMDFEKHRITTQRSELEFRNHEFLDKLKGCKAALNIEIAKNQELKSRLSRILKGIHCANNVVDQPQRLKKAVVKLHHRTENQAKGRVEKSGELECGSDFIEKIRHFEKCLHMYKMLKCKLKNNTSDKKEQLKSDNTWLIMERNTLKHEVELIQSHVKDLKCVIGLDSKGIMPSEARDRLQAALKSREDIKNMYKEKMKEYTENISSLQDKVNVLQKSFEESELPKEAIKISLRGEIDENDVDIKH